MKKILLLFLIALLFSCKALYLKNDEQYPDKFTVDGKTKANGYVYYWDETGKYYIYHKKDKLDIDSVYNIRPTLFKKHLKVSK